MKSQTIIWSSLVTFYFVAFKLSLLLLLLTTVIKDIMISTNVTTIDTKTSLTYQSHHGSKTNNLIDLY